MRPYFFVVLVGMAVFQSVGITAIQSLAGTQKAVHPLEMGKSVFYPDWFLFYVFILNTNFRWAGMG
jgi:hypothetical protein